MTLLGKILVCVNLVFSLTLASFALAVYTHRLNWTNTPAQATPERAAGELAQLQDRIKEKWAALTRDNKEAEFRLASATHRLRLLEQQRPADQHWYAVELGHTIRGATEKDPVRLLVFEEGRLKLDPANQNRPALQPGTDRHQQPLQSLEYYHAQNKKAYDEINAERENLGKLVMEDDRLTAELIGPKGLRQRIEEEEDKKKSVERELRDFLKPALVNVQIESDLVIRRRDALRERVEELRKAPALRP